MLPLARCTDRLRASRSSSSSRSRRARALGYVLRADVQSTSSVGLSPSAGPSAEMAPCCTLAPLGVVLVGELGPSSPRKRECAVPRERPRASTFPPRTNQLPDHARARRPASADWQSVSRNGVRNGVHVPLSWREFSPSVQHSHSLPRPHALRLLPGKGTTSSLPGDFLEVELCRAEVPRRELHSRPYYRSRPGCHYFLRP